MPQAILLSFSEGLCSPRLYPPSEAHDLVQKKRQERE